MVTRLTRGMALGRLREESGYHRRGGGFTLIELLVVVSIIVLLIAILLPSLGKARRVSIRTKCGTNLHAIGRAVQMYASENEMANLSQAAGLNSGWSGNQTVYFRNDLYPGWSGINYLLGSAVGGIKSKVLICSAVPTRGALDYQVNGQDWIDAWPGTTSSNGPKNSGVWSRGTYMFFVGDQGNGDGSKNNTPMSNTEPGYRQNPNGKCGYFRSDSATPYNVIYVPPKLNRTDPGQVLVQDLLYFDEASQVYLGNHTAAAAYIPESTPSNKRYNAGYFLSAEERDFEGCNVLMATFAVEWRRPADLTQVRADSGSNGAMGTAKRFYLGVQPLVP